VNRRSLFATVAATVAALGLLPAASASAVERPVHSSIGPAYYLALGDSLAQGVQPTSTGASVITNHGYVDDLYALYRRSDPRLRLVKLGCPGETTTSMISGGVCPATAYQPYGASDQLDAAVHFLTAHRGQVALVTLDIGANNVDGCFSGTDVVGCVTRGIPRAGTELGTILTVLRAADPNGRIVGMNYYDPFLAAWLQGTAGQQTARDTVTLTDSFNGVLAGVYKRFSVPVADVAAEYRTDDFTVIPLVHLPVNVASVCLLTWMCAPSPVGPNIHANTPGYRVIADAFVDVVGRALRTG
jgi:lysophospholipase L1-like esterase